MPVEYIVGGILSALFIYTILPTILIRLFSIGGIQTGPRGHREVYLTFDDGPDPVHTPQVLDILKQHNIKATFFVTGVNALKNINIIKTFVHEGHNIGIHGMNHSFSWFASPTATVKNIKSAADTIHNATGKATVLFRAPWGLYNLVNYFSFIITGHHSVLWSFMSWDWTKNCNEQRITNCIRSKLKNGAIIVLHDSAGPVCSNSAAPKQMIKALPKIIKEIYDQGYKIGDPVKLETWSQLGWYKRATVGLWSLWERFFAYAAGVKPLTEAVDSAFSLAVRKYRGKPLNLPDGTLIKPGDLMGELHFDNNLLLNITSQARAPERVATALLRNVRKSLPQVADALRSDPRYNQVKAVYGVTIIHRGAKFLGFNIFEIYPHLLRVITTWYQRWLLIVFHPNGFSHLIKHRSKMVPKMLVMSKDQLVQRYSTLDHNAS
ncbi:MAG: polysaccharide deacetylase family protein [Firmicutes bacterium]|nr:polysaccharide deacetylase family protein [Bacillota bacterium]